MHIDPENSPGDEEDSSRQYGSVAYKIYVLVILTLILSCHALDRALPNLLIEPIRKEYHLSDGQLGVFSGLAFALSFSLAILPMGYLSDRVNRRNMLTVLLVVWSACTALGGVARTYVELLAARLGVGAAESGAAPTIIPMLTNIFTPSKRGTALGILYMSNSIGLFLASVVGSLIAVHYGWRAAMFLAAGPGLLLAVILLWTVREPVRASSSAVASGGTPTPLPSLAETFVFLSRKPALIAVMMGGALFGTVVVTLWAWTGSFFIRVHQLTLPQVGLVIGVAGGLGHLISPPIIGWLGDRIGRFDPRLPLLLLSGTALLTMVTGMAMLFVSSVSLAILLFLVSGLCQSYSPICYSAIMNNTPSRLRGSVMSVIQLITNILAFGIGPALVGVISDFYGGGSAIRYAMAHILALLAISAALWLWASRRMEDTNAQGRLAEA